MQRDPPPSSYVRESGISVLPWTSSVRPTAAHPFAAECARSSSRTATAVGLWSRSPCHRDQVITDTSFCSFAPRSAVPVTGSTSSLSMSNARGTPPTAIERGPTPSPFRIRPGVHKGIATLVPALPIVRRSTHVCPSSCCACFQGKRGDLVVHRQDLAVVGCRRSGGPLDHSRNDGLEGSEVTWAGFP